MLDVAALHPDLDPNGHLEPRHYFRRCADLADEILRRIVEGIGGAVQHRFLVGNTTAGLLASLVALRAAGCDVEPMGRTDQHYHGYRDLFPARREDRATWEFRTHVSPSTARIDPLTRVRPVLVDAAQSLGTTLTATLLRRADIVVAPLHKHLGLGVGLGLVLVPPGSAVTGRILDILSTAASGTHSLNGLIGVARQLDRIEDRLVNRCVLTLDEAMDQWCRSHGVRLLAREPGPPFACLTTIDGVRIDHRLRSDGSWRMNGHSNTARFAFHLRGYPTDPPVDVTDRLRDRIAAVLL